MCRLLGWAALEPASVSSLLDGAELGRLAALSSFHGDGWGLSAGAELRARSTAPAGTDPAFEASLALPSTTGILHLRRASPGYRVSPENTHPFAAGGWSFAHNGTITRPEAIDDLVGADGAARRRGETDSERYFLAFLERVRSGDRPDDALAATVESIRERSTGALNAVACSATTLVAVQAASGAQPTRESLVSLMGEAVALPGNGVDDDHLDDYFGLRMLLGAGSVAVASTGAPGPRWTPVPEESVLLVDLEARAVELRPIDGGPRGRWRAELG